MERTDKKKVIFAIIAVVAFAVSVATAVYVVMSKIRKQRTIKEFEDYLDCVIE